MGAPAGHAQRLHAAKKFLLTASIALAALLPAPPQAQVVTLTPSSLPPPTVGFSYSQAMAASGGDAPYAFTIESGMLPPGLTLAPNGQISGTTANTSSFAFALYGTDFNGREGILSTTLSAAPALMLANSSVVFQIGQAVNMPIAAANGTAPYACNNLSAAPPGLNLSTGCVLSGNPASLGSTLLGIHIVDNNGVQGNVNLSILVTPILVLANPTIGRWTGTPFSIALGAANGVAPYSCTVLSALPPGVTISPTCVLTGTQTVAGAYVIRLHMVDNVGANGDVDLTLDLMDPLIIPVDSGWMLVMLSLLLAASGWLYVRSRRGTI